MHKYQSFQVVRAGKIINATYTELYEKGVLYLDTGEKIKINFEFIKKYDPMIGGYYILNPDSYTSYLSAETFENGYIRVE